MDFFRTGPDSFQNGHSTWSDDTDQDGNAYYTWQGVKAGKASYTFAGTDAGTATVTAVVYDKQPSDGGQELGHTNQQAIKFGPKAVRIDARLTAVNARATNGGVSNDIAKVNAPASAKGAVVKLYKIRKDGSKVLVAKKVANRAGDVSFLVKDSSKSKVTKFQAFVGATKATLSDWTNRLSIR